MNMPIDILIVEDHLETAEALREFMAVHDIHADIATSGKQALSLVAKRNYHCLLTDIVLPDSNGLEIAARIKARNKEMGIIFLTARKIILKEVKRKLGFDCAVLEKPCKLFDILGCVNQYGSENHRRSGKP